MPPKKRVLEVPCVTPAERQKAVQTLEDAAEAKRQRSSMTAFLEKNGTKGVYDNWPISKRREFFECYFAQKLAEGTGKESTTRRTSMSKLKRAEVNWWSLSKMITEFGEAKAKEKARVLDAIPGRHRPDPDTKLDDMWNREYRVTLDSERDDDATVDESNIQTTFELVSEEQKKEAADRFADMTSCISGSPCSANVAIKKEPGTEGAQSKDAADKATSPHAATLEAMKKDPKKVAANASKVLVTAKEVFVDTKGKKFMGELRDESAKVVSELTATYKKIEKAIVDKASDDPTLLAVSTNLDSAFDHFNEMVGWYQKLVPKSSAKKGKAS
eukprot:1165224-Pyramimonas_sp.AAC.1